MAITYDKAKGGYTDGATTWSPNSDGVYEIGNLDQLKFFRDAVNDGNSFNGQTVKLTDSIDLNKEEWTPIGKNGAPFQGTFDGQEKTVSNLKITRGTSNVAANCGIGFFGYTNSPATITNLTINNVDITGSLYVGAIVGYGYTGKEISNCHVTGQIEIEGWWYIGGIGGNGYVSKVSDCSVVGNEGSYIKALNDGSYVGGIWGYRGEGNNTIADCAVDNIDISGMDRIGGICGIAHYVNTIEECSISNSSITADNNIGNVGLIAGANLGNATNGPAILLNNTVDVTTKENFTLEGQVIENPPVLGANINTGAPAQAAIIGDVTRNEAGEIVDGTISVVGTEKDSIDVSSKLDLADGLAFYPNSDGTIGVDEAGYVASVNNIRYKSLADAIAAAGAGGTVTLIDDVTLSSKLVLNQAQVFDLNGFTLDGAVSLSGEADVTFQNGKMTAAYSSTTSNSYSVVQVNGSSVLTLDGVTLTPADSSNRSQATHAIVYQSTGALNIKNSTVAGGNLVHDKNYTSGTNQAACAIYAYGNSAGTIQIEESTITGGAGKTDAEYDGTYKSGLYVEGGEAIKLGGSAAITINSSTVTGGASDWYNAADAVNVTNTFSGTLNIENASKISGGDALNLSGETSRGIGGAGIYTNQSTSCTEIVVTDSEIEGGNGGHSWNGSALELNTSAPEVTITNSTLTVGQGENSSGNAGAIRVNNTNTIDLNLNGVTLDGAGNANQVFQITSNVSNGGISLAGENTISGGTLENVTFIEVAEGTTITTTGDGKVDPVTVLNPVSTPVYDETTGAYVFEPVETSTETLLVNSNWASLPDGTAVQYDGANYRLGFNAFGDMNTAVSSIDRSYELNNTFDEPITIKMTDATSGTLDLYGMNLVLTGDLTSSGSWNLALVPVASSGTDPNYITYLKLDKAQIEMTGTAALEGVNWGKAAVSFDKDGNIIASADQTIQRGAIVELVNGTVFDADNQVNGRGIFFKIDGTSQIYQYGSGNALITMTSGAIVDGGQSTAGDYTSVNQLDARWIYFGKGSGEWEGIYGDKTYFTFRNGANVEAKDRIEFGTGSLLKEMDVEIDASRIVATNNMIIGTEDNAGKITSFVVSNNSLLQAGTDLSIVGTTVELSDSTLNAATVTLTDGKLNVSGTSAITAAVGGAIDIVDGADVTFGAGSTSDDLRIASGAEVTLQGSLSSGNIYGVDEEGTHEYNDGSDGITVNVVTGDGETFKSYAWYASNGSTYNVMAGSNVELTYANINATGTVNVAEGATLTTVRESSNIVGTLNVDGTMNGVMTVYAGYTGGQFTNGAQAGEVNINGTGTVNTSIMTIGTAVRDDDQYNAAAVEGSNTTASVVVDGGTLNATGFEGELTSKLFVGSDDSKGVLTGKNGAKINVGERSANGTGYMRFLIGEKGTLNLDNSTMTVYNLGGTNNSGEGVFQNSGAIKMDVDSQIVTATALKNNGTITVDMTGAAEFGVYKLIDYTGTGTGSINYGSIQLSNNNYSTRIIVNDLYLVRADGAKELYVNSAWQSAAAYKEVTFVDGTTAYYGLNAFDTVDNAVKSLSANAPILLNVTGGVEAITVVGASVTEVNASAKPADITEDTVIDTDAIVVNLVEIDNTDAGWQVYYPLASGSNAQVYGDITTNFLSTTFTYEGERTGDPNFSGAGYAGTTATVYGNTTVNIGEVDADNSKLTLNTGFLLGAGGGTVNGDSSLNIYSGTIEAGAVVGGGAWGGLVKGDSSVTISGGEITLGTSTYNAVYGGSYGYANPTSAETRGSASVTIKGDAVVNGKVIGGSDQTAVTGTTVEISGEAQVNGNVYAGGNRGGQVTGNTSVKVNGGTVNGNVFGGGYASDVTGTTSLVMTGGTVNGALLGGGEEGNVGDTSIEVSGGTIYSGVAGGGASGTAGNTKVHITGDTQITGGGYGVVLGGGQYIGADVESTSVVIEGNVRITDTWAVEDEGTGLNYGYVYGGGWSGSVNGDTNVVVKGNALVASGVLGGGSWSDSDPYEGSVKGNTYVEIAENAVIGDTHEGYVYGGGWGQNVEGSATVVIKDNATIKHSVVGGGIDSTVASTDVRIEGGTVGKNIYAGGYYNDSTLPVENSDVLGDASVTISGGTVSGNVYAGGFYSNVNGNASLTLSGGAVGGDIYGGSEGSGTVAGSSTLNVGATDAERYTTTLNNVYDFDVANITNAAVTVEGVFSATQISIADSTLTLNSGFDAATTTVSIEVGAYNAENAALVLGSAVGTAPAISISAGSNALTEARYLVATGFDDTTAFSLDESLAGDYLLRAVDGNIYLYNADAPYFTTELSVTQAEGASVDGYYSFTANFEAAGLLTGYTLKLYDSATATTPVDEVTLDADVIGQEFTLENTTQSFWISVTANGENGLSTDSPTSGRLEVVVTDYDSPVIQSVSSNVASDAITLTCEATDNFGVTGYEFILDGQSLGVQTGSEIALDLSTLTAGTHSYTVNVYDAAGNLATSAEQSFDFTPEPGPGPEPGPTEPANFLYSSQVRMDNGETVSVYATYSDAAAALEYRIGDSGEWLTYDATTGVNVSSSTTVYFREQGITDPVETAVDVTVVPADVELNAEVILLAPTTDTTYEVIYNFADGGSKAVELSGNSVEHYALPENTTVTIVEKDASGEVVNTIVEETPAASTTAEIPDKVVAVDDGHDNLFFAMPIGQWGTGIAAQHLGDGTWGGTLEIVSLTGKNRFSTVFTGSNDATTLFLTDDANGDVFFLDDIYTANGSDARIRKMSEIQAGAGDDIVDLTSARFAYEEHASKQLTVRGGDGNDILWGNAGHNIMFGDDGNDRIYGGSDNDVLIGGTGNDTMLGGGGDDIFCYGSSFDWGSDTITQLSGGTVTLYLDGIDRNDCSISGSTLTWNDGTHTGSITLNGVSWDSVKFYCAANGDGDLTKQSDYEELKNKGAFAAISSH